MTKITPIMFNFYLLIFVDYNMIKITPVMFNFYILIFVDYREIYSKYTDLQNFMDL